MTELTKTGKTLEFVIALLLISVGVVLRLLPHAPNFTPIATIALFGGAYFSRKTAFILPIVAMLVSDAFLGFYEPKLMMSVYGSFVLTILLGLWLKNHKKWYTVAGATILSSTLFFLITNFSFWAFGHWYAKSFSGLVQCYLMALPFFRNTLLGDAFFVLVLFGTYELMEVWIRATFKLKEKSPNYVKI